MVLAANAFAWPIMAREPCQKGHRCRLATGTDCELLEFYFRIVGHRRRRPYGRLYGHVA
jgi:hypothetical protein